MQQQAGLMDCCVSAAASTGAQALPCMWNSANLSMLYTLPHQEGCMSQGTAGPLQVH